MRVSADTNLFISYLLKPSDTYGFISAFFEALAKGRFTLLMPQDLIEEIVDVIQRKTYLQSRINEQQLAALVSTIKSISEEIPRIEEPIPRICRDPKDDYLLAYAVVGQADYLVTGDKDLLVLQQVDTLKIISPSELQHILH